MVPTTACACLASWPRPPAPRRPTRSAQPTTQPCSTRPTARRTRAWSCQGPHGTGRPARVGGAPDGGAGRRARARRTRCRAARSRAAVLGMPRRVWASAACPPPTCAWGARPATAWSSLRSWRCHCGPRPRGCWCSCCVWTLWRRRAGARGRAACTRAAACGGAHSVGAHEAPSRATACRAHICVLATCRVLRSPHPGPLFRRPKAGAVATRKGGFVAGGEGGSDSASGTDDGSASSTDSEQRYC